MDKSNDIQFLSDDLKNIEQRIKLSKAILQNSSKIVIEDEGDIIVWEQLKLPLSKFLVSYFEKEKQDVYCKMKDILK